MKYQEIDLTLDASKEDNIILLSSLGTPIAKKVFNIKKEKERSLLLTVTELLEENQITPENIRAIFVGIGPGSYTGVRIAVSIGEGLSLGLNIPLYSFHSALAYLPDTLQNGPFTALLKAKHNHFVLKGRYEDTLIPGSFSYEIVLEEKSPEDFPIENPLPISIEEESPLNTKILLPYLNKLKKEPISPPKIIYLHDF